MAARTSQDSQFRYGHFTNSCLELFDKVPVLQPIQSSHVQEVYPSTSLDESSIEFNFMTDRNIYLDMRDIHLNLKVSFQEGRLFDYFKKESMKKEEHTKKDGEKDDLIDFDSDYNHEYLTMVNNMLHSLFSNCEVYINNQQIYNSNGLYPHKAFISNEFNAAISDNRGILHCHGFDTENNPGDYDSSPFTERSNILHDGFVHTFYGRMAIDFFNCEKLMLPNSKIRLKLIRSNPNFYMISNNPYVSFKIQECSLFTRRVVVAPDYHATIEYQLMRQPAQYNFMETIARTFIIPNGQNQFVQENVFNNAPIRRIAIAMNTNAAFTGSFDQNPFWYQKFGLREVRIIRGGTPVVIMDTTNNARPYVTTMKAMNFNEDVPSLDVDTYDNHYILVFDLTSLQDAGEQVYYPELVGESLRLEMFFDHPLFEVTEVIVLGERISTVKIDKFGTVAKNV